MFRRCVVVLLVLATFLGVSQVDHRPPQRAGASPQQGTMVAGIPSFFDFVIDDANARLFGSDKAAGRIVVLGLPDLNTIGTIPLGQGSSPSGLSLSPDGTQLAVALFGSGTIALIDTSTLSASNYLSPTVTHSVSQPHDVRFGRAGRLYSVGSAGRSGLDYIHVFDTATNIEIGMSSVVVRDIPRIVISADHHTLYVTESGEQLSRFDITTDSPVKTGEEQGVRIIPAIATNTDGSAVYTSWGNVWSAGLQTLLGTFNAFGFSIEYVPALDRLFVSQESTVVEVDAQAPFDVLARRPVNGVAGVARANAAGTRLYVSTSVGMEVIRFDLPAYELTAQFAGNGMGRVLGAGTYSEGGVAILTAAPTLNNDSFVGWHVDGVYAGWANPLTLTVDAAHVVQATFSHTIAFSDVHPTPPDFHPVTELATRGMILGFSQHHFGVWDGVQRAQMAALIARAMPAGPGTPPNVLHPPSCVVAGTWDCEHWGNSFTDQSGDLGLWRNVGTLRHYGVAYGYGEADCEKRGVEPPCFAPHDPVTYAQTISFITRAMIVKGFWLPQPTASQPYLDVPAAHAGDFRTFHFYTSAFGGIPSPPGNWSVGASRGWFAFALWGALDSYWGKDIVMPDGRVSGGYRP